MHLFTCTDFFTNLSFSSYGKVAFHFDGDVGVMNFFVKLRSFNPLLSESDTYRLGAHYEERATYGIFTDRSIFRLPLQQEKRQFRLADVMTSS